MDFKMSNLIHRRAGLKIDKRVCGVQASKAKTPKEMMDVVLL